MNKFFLDITKDHCPMTFVKAKLKLEELEKGDELEILLTSGEPLKNVPNSIEEVGARVVRQEMVGNNYLLVVKK